MRKIFTIAILALSTNAFAQTICTNDTIISIANLPAVRNSARSAVYNSDIYVFGGADNSSVTNSTYKYSTITNSWSTLTNMLSARGEMGVAEVNGIVYCIGGWTGSPSNKNEAYNISTNSWQTMLNLPTALIGCYAVSLNNKVYIIGGTLGNTTTYFYEYNPSTNSYTTLTTPTQSRIHSPIVMFNNKIYFVGGHYYNGTYGSSNHLDEYDPSTNTWTAKAPIPVNLQRMGATIYDSKLYTFGGTTAVPTITPLNSQYVYDFASNSWTTMANLPFSMAIIEATTVNNIVYLIGGMPTSTTSTAQCYKYYCLDYVCHQIIYDTVTVTNYVSVTDTLIINALLTGINPPNNANIIKIFPNPASTHLFIDCGNYTSMNGYTIRIDNSLGQTVYTTTISQQQYYINLSSWSGNGTYFVYIIDGLSNTIDVRKIILQ